MAPTPSPPAAETETYPQHANRRKSLLRSLPRTGHGGRFARKVAFYLAPIAGLLTTGRVAGGTPGLLVAGALVVIATPIVAFALNQVLLTDKGRRLATTVADVRSLKETDSTAFARFFTPRYDATSAGLGMCLKCGSYARDDKAAPMSVESGNSSSSTFWTSLTDTERSWLAAVAREESFVTGTVLCRQDDPAQHVFILISGQAVVYVVQNGEQRCIAVRGAGDIIGERAAIEERPRSASVVAVIPTQALVIATSDFAAFLQTRPRVLAVLERQVYDGS
jgi:hypothetical protein